MRHIRHTLLVLLCFSSAAQAATEYLRLKGTINPDYSGPMLPEDLHAGHKV